MPLSKTIEVSVNGALTGVNATYWVLERIDFRLLQGVVLATLNGYVSSAAYSGGKSRITDRPFSASTPGSFSTMTGAQMVQTVYDYIKTQPEFTGATDAA